MSDLDLIYKPKKPAQTAPQPEKKKEDERILTSKQVSNKVSKQASKEDLKEASIEERLLASLQNPDLKANTFRYTQEELDFIRDIVYEGETKHGVKLDKNDIARLGLAWLMEDWKGKKEDSLLARVLTSKKTRK